MTLTRKFKISLLLAALLPLTLGGCLAAAGAVGAVVLSQGMFDNNAYVSHVNLDVRHVWPETKMFLAEQSLDLIEDDDEARVAVAKIDGTNVTVGVEAYDAGKSIIKVQARRFGVNDGELARVIMERIHRRLEQSVGSL